MQVMAKEVTTRLHTRCSNVSEKDVYVDLCMEAIKGGNGDKLRTLFDLCMEVIKGRKGDKLRTLFELMAPLKENASDIRSGVVSAIAQHICINECQENLQFLKKTLEGNDYIDIEETVRYVDLYMEAIKGRNGDKLRTLFELMAPLEENASDIRSGVVSAIAQHICINECQENLQFLKESVEDKYYREIEKAVQKEPSSDVSDVASARSLGPIEGKAL